MKKIITSILAILMVILLLTVVTGCGNHSLGFGNYNFKRIHIFTHDGNDQCLTVEKWYEDDVGIEVKTKECGALWLSEGTYMLCENECPICGAKMKGE